MNVAWCDRWQRISDFKHKFCDRGTTIIVAILEGPMQWLCRYAAENLKYYTLSIVFLAITRLRSPQPNFESGNIKRKPLYNIPTIYIYIYIYIYTTSNLANEMLAKDKVLNTVNSVEQVIRWNSEYNSDNNFQSIHYIYICIVYVCIYVYVCMYIPISKKVS